MYFLMSRKENPNHKAMWLGFLMQKAHFIIQRIATATGVCYLIVVCSKRGEKIMNYTYIVECKDGTLYTGWTNNLEKRIADHNSGKGAKYTRARKPVTLVYYETFEAKEEAMKREYAIKHMSRKEKEKLIEHFPIL